MTLKTSGDLRSFLGDVLLGIRSGTVDVDEANAIAKVSAQITNSLALEIKSAIMARASGAGDAKVGDMQLTTSDPVSIPATKPDDVWCDQCDKMVAKEVAESCKSAFCKARDL